MEFKFNPTELCSCGKVHKTMVEHVTIRPGAIDAIPEYADI